MNENHPGDSFDATAALKHRGCFEKRMGFPALKGLTKVEHEIEKTIDYFYNGKKLEVSTRVDADLSAAKEVREYMRRNHRNPELNWGGGWGAYCKSCDESKISSDSWVASCASQDVAPFSPLVNLNVFSDVGFDKSCANKDKTSNSFDTNEADRRCGNRFSAASQCKCPVANKLDKAAIEMSGMNMAWKLKDDQRLKTCVRGDEYDEKWGTDLARRLVIGRNTGMNTGKAWTRADFKPGWPTQDTLELQEYKGLNGKISGSAGSGWGRKRLRQGQCGTIEYDQMYKWKNKRCW
jgi:hypothetical protein